MLIDATDANTANVLRGSVAGVTRAFNASLAGGRAGTAAPGLVRADVRLWYNPGRRDREYIVPGALVVCLALLPPLLAALATSREREAGTILQVYVSGVRAHEYLLGKIGAYFSVAAVVWGMVSLLTVFVFGLRPAGDPTPFLVGSALFLWGMISFGVMVGARTPDQATAIQAMQIGGFVLSFLLSGFLFPVENIPGWLSWISAVVPARHYIEIVRDGALRGGGWPAVGGSVLALGALAAVFFAAAWARMRRMQLEG
jgi:ABC-2 type transport system permease protein